MGLAFRCDAPGCSTSAPARVTALQVGQRDRENPAESPVIYLPPIGWTPVVIRSYFWIAGRRLYACSRACRDEILGREGREPTGRLIGAACPACGQSVDGEGPTRPCLAVARDFLTGDHVEILMWLASVSVFEPGRQGTGYEKTAVDARVLEGVRHFESRHRSGDSKISAQLEALVASSLAALGADAHAAHDCYLLRSRSGAYVPPHKDSAPLGASHRRINAIVRTADEGGELRVDGEVVPLNRRDAYVFRPDLQEHGVSTVVRGERLVWSVGVVV